MSVHEVTTKGLYTMPEELSRIVDLIAAGATYEAAEQQARRELECR